MRVIGFIEPRAPERSDGRGDVIEKILRGHRRAAMVGGLWHPSGPRAPPAGDGWVHDPDDDSDESRELTYVDIDTFEATF